MLQNKDIHVAESGYLAEKSNLLELNKVVYVGEQRLNMHQSPTLEY